VILRRAGGSPAPWLLAGLLLAYVAAVGLQVPEMLSLASAHDVLLAMLPLLILALGQSFVLMVGQIDLSVTASMSFASVIAAMVMTSQGGWLAGSPWAVPAGLAVFVLLPAALAACIGGCVVVLRAPSFLVSLALMMFLAGAAQWFVSRVADSSSIGDLPAGFVVLGYGDWLGLTMARLVGVAFVCCGVYAGIAALLLAARLETGTPLLAEKGLLLDIIGAAVIGGVSLQGGRGTVPGIVTGVLLLAVLDKGLQLLGLSLFLVLAIKGAVILLAALLDGWRRP